MTWQDREAARLERAAVRAGILRQIAASAGQIVSLLKSPPAGDVLGAGTRIIPATGALELRWPVPFASVAICNYGTAALSVTSDGTQAGPPSVGAGALSVPGGCFRVLTLRGTVLTVYGPAGAAFDATVYSSHRAPVGSAV